MAKPDWEAIELAYRAGLMSLREIRNWLRNYGHFCTSVISRSQQCVWKDMSSNRAIDLEQALIAVIGAYKNSGGDVKKLKQDAIGLIVGNSTYRIVEHPNVSSACKEIENAAEFKK